MELIPAVRRPATLSPLIAGIPLAAIAVAAWDPARNGGPPLCPFRGLTGVACPGCGLTRAAGALLRGRFDDALHLHPLILVLVAQLAVVWVIGVVAAYRSGSGDRSGAQNTRSRVIPAVVAANAALFVGVWLVRLAGGSLDTSV